MKLNQSGALLVIPKGVILKFNIKMLAICYILSGLIELSKLSDEEIANLKQKYPLNE